ncbi:MAG: hypothetical protein N3E36_05810 [Sulfolobales archaeon]|nr:hypothetical protein [Sulfolobales archaeon]MCX8199523.1 hypothetical protein [Sulfolobales archaeon]MDW8170476.1 hypothetical protein [Desulfurococcaceae archaeon]
MDKRFGKQMKRKQLINVITLVGLVCLAIALFYSIGYAIGSGYSFEVKHFVSPKPQRLSIVNFSNPLWKPVMIITGPNCTQVRLNEGEKVFFQLIIPPYDGLSCSLIPPSTYECSGPGVYYVCSNVAVSEVVIGSEVSKNYYFGEALAYSTNVVLYGFEFSLLTALVFNSMASAMMSMLSLRMLRKGKHLAILILAISIESMALGFIEGIEVIPKDLGAITKYLVMNLFIGMIVLSSIQLTIYRFLGISRAIKRERI